MSAQEAAARQAFRRIGERELECLHSPAMQKPVEWVTYESAARVNAELGRLEAKNWWQGCADSAAFLWHVNEMRREAGLPPLSLRPGNWPCGSVVEEGGAEA